LFVVYWECEIEQENIQQTERSGKMEQNSSKGQNSRKTAYYAGAGLAIGAAIGMIFGLMLFENLVLGSAIGAGVGLVIGAAIDAQGGLLK
jgi:uncharacterized membrane protein